MKIHTITLKDYNQFKDLNIDLTYPKGHEKAGQPLDKVCFIGQSGTGKTSLLRLIKYCVTNNRGIGTGISLDPIENGKVSMKMGFNDYEYLSIPSEDTMYITNLHDITTSDEWFSNWQKAKSDFFEQNKPTLINFPTERISGNVSVLPIEKIKELPDDQKNERINYLENLKLDISVDFAFEDTSKAWDFVLSDIKKYLASELDWRNKIAETVLKSDSIPHDFDQISKEYQLWLKDNHNPLEELAKEMNKILVELGLKIKTDIDKESILHLGSIMLQTLEGVTIDRNFWSTGTKQIVDTLMPLVEIKPKNAIILIDEPERSLYPNLQQKIIDLYTSQGTNCQYFFATHSPIIASSFDPWEIVELKFDESHINVVQETNYKDERHIDNYTVYPKYLRWDKILMNLFDLTDEGNNDFRILELTKIIALKGELNTMKESGLSNDSKFKKKLDEFLKLQSKVGWHEEI